MALCLTDTGMYSWPKLKKFLARRPAGTPPPELEGASWLKRASSSFSAGADTCQYTCRKSCDDQRQSVWAVLRLQVGQLVSQGCG